MDLVVRRGAEGDGPAAAALCTVEWGVEAEPERMAGDLERYPSAVAYVSRELVGVAHCARFGPDVLELRDMVVRRDVRGQGVGALLLAEMERSALEGPWRGVVLVNSMGYAGKERLATAFYERAGYEQVLDTGLSVVYAKLLPAR